MAACMLYTRCNAWHVSFALVVAHDRGLLLMPPGIALGEASRRVREGAEKTYATGYELP